MCIVVGGAVLCPEAHFLRVRQVPFAPFEGGPVVEDSNFVFEFTGASPRQPQAPLGGQGDLFLSASRSPGRRHTERVARPMLCCRQTRFPRHRPPLEGHSVRDGGGRGGPLGPHKVRTDPELQLGLGLDRLDPLQPGGAGGRGTRPPRGTAHGGRSGGANRAVVVAPGP